MGEALIIKEIEDFFIILGDLISSELFNNKTYSQIVKHAQRAIKNLSEIKKAILKVDLN